MERNDLVHPHDAFDAVLAALLTGFTQIQKDPRRPHRFHGSLCTKLGSKSTSEHPPMHGRNRLMKPFVEATRRHV